MASCISDIAGNIGLNCESPISGGYTGRGVYIPMESEPTLTKEAGNPRVITAVALGQGKKLVKINNEGATPFTGSTTTGTGDNGRPQFVKTAQIMMPERGAKFAVDVAEPLVKSGRGGILILEKIDRVGDGSFEVIGSQQAVKVVDPSTVARNEYENGGAWTATLQTTEDYMEVSFFDTDYETTLAKFEALLALAF